jgi:hypothetical protein
MKHLVEMLTRIDVDDKNAIEERVKTSRWRTESKNGKQKTCITYNSDAGKQKNGAKEWRCMGRR